MAEHDLKGDKLQINSIESKEEIRVSVKNILTYATGHDLEDFDLVYKQEVERMIDATPGLGNRFRTIILVDDNDVEISRITTDGIRLTQIFSANGELLFQLGPAGAPAPPVIPPDLDIAWTLSENQPDFLELNIHFRAPDGSVLSDHYSQGSGLVGDGGFKPKSGQLMRIDLTYYGGTIDPNDNPVAEWDGPVRVILEIRRNGVLFDSFIQEYPTPPPIGTLTGKFIQPTEFHTWTVLARPERYTPVEPDGQISSVDSPPVAVIRKSLVGGGEMISGGTASVNLYGEDSYDVDGDVITYLWTFDNPNVVITPI